jgi:hypothetical protein
MGRKFILHRLAKTHPVTRFNPQKFNSVFFSQHDIEFVDSEGGRWLRELPDININKPIGIRQPPS